MMLPDNEADYGDHELEPDEEFDLSELGPEALAWQLLLLINPGDEDAAMRQFSGYREALIEAGGEAADPVWLLKDAIDCLAELVARWNLEIDWGGDQTDEEFLQATDIPALMATAHDRLRERGYTLWTWDTGSDSYAGWITRSGDDEAMRLVAAALEIELRPGSDSF